MRKKSKFKMYVGVFIFIASVLLGIYFGGWIMFIQPILEACKAFDTGTLTAVMVGTTIIKCIFASTVGGLIVWLGTKISFLFLK